MWLPKSVIPSSAGDIDIKPMKKESHALVTAVAIFLVVAFILTIFFSQDKYYLSMYDQNIATREELSKTVQPKWKTEKTYLITQTHGSSTPFNVVKFECCGAQGMVANNQLYLGYLDTVEATPIGTTTKTQIPIIGIETIGHELVHLVTLQPYVLEQCPALANRDLQEKIAYNWGHLYAQIRSFDEDNWIRLEK